MNTDNNITQFVEFVIALQEQYGNDEETIIKKIDENFSFENCDAEDLLELIRIGLFRASVIAENGSYPKSNLDKNSFVITAKNIGLKKLGKTELITKKNSSKRKWWKLW